MVFTAISAIFDGLQLAEIDNAIHHGIDSLATDRFRAYLLADVAAVEDNRRGGDVEHIGYLLVYVALNDERQHIFLALREEFALLLIHAGLHPVCRMCRAVHRKKSLQ